MRRRLTRWGKWAGLAATMLLLTLMGASALGRVGSIQPRWGCIWVGRGALQVWVLAPPERRRTGGMRFEGPGPEPGTRFTWSFEHIPVAMLPPVSVTTVPLWWLCAAVLLPTAALWWLDRRARRGGCGRCGYSLGGLPAGAPCPECGQGAAP